MGDCANRNPSCKIRILMRIRRGAAAEEAQGSGGGDLVPCTRWNENGVAGGDFLGGAVDFHGSGAFEEKVDLFAQFVVMAVGGGADREAGFGKALVFDRSICAIEDTAYRGAIFGREWFLTG